MLSPARGEQENPVISTYIAEGFDTDLEQISVFLNMG